MQTLTTKTYGESLRDMVEEYRSTGQPWPASTKEIAQWAYNTRRWEPQPGNEVRQCARDVARAMREDCYTDPQGRKVRTKHVARITKEDGTQMMLWADIRTAEPDHMERAFQQRREQIVRDCCQLKTDVDSYSENNDYGAKFQLCFDFVDDIAESEALQEFDTESLRRGNPR